MLCSRSTWRVFLVPNGNKFVWWGRNWWQYTLLPWTDLWSQGRQNFAELKKYWLMAYICRGGESQSWSKSCSTDRWPQRLGRRTHQVVETLGRKFCIGSCSLVVRYFLFEFELSKHYFLLFFTIYFLLTRFLEDYLLDSSLVGQHLIRLISFNISSNPIYVR